MGNIYIPLKSFLKSLDVKVIEPPPCNKRTMELGVKYSPEFACLPLKINIGNYLEAIELGADTIIMAGGIGPCRFGYYAEVQREILMDLGLNIQMIVLEPPQGNYMHLIKRLQSLIGTKNCSLGKIVYAAKLAWQKALILDELDKIACAVRPLEKNAGDTEQAYKTAINKIDNAKNPEELKETKQHIDQLFQQICQRENITLPKIGIMGEIYTVLEPFVNFNVEKILGELGVFARRSIYLTDWVRHNLLPGFLKPKDLDETLKMAKPYINCFVGGHGQESVAQAVKFSKEGYSGVIQLLPFTCMPEIVAKSVLPQVSKDYSLPIMTLVLDEHSGEAGVRTRLEAFIDMIKHNLEVGTCEKVFPGN